MLSICYFAASFSTTGGQGAGHDCVKKISMEGDVHKENNSTKVTDEFVYNELTFLNLEISY